MSGTFAASAAKKPQPPSSAPPNFSGTANRTSNANTPNTMLKGTVQEGGSTGGASCIRITPSVGEFSDVEPGLVFVIPFVIHNVSNRVTRVRFTPPKTNVFRVIHSQQSIAPGMKQVVEVEFSSKDIRDYHDVLVVRCEDGETEIPLHAWFPAPNLKFDPLIDLGRVSAQHPMEAKKFKITNVGKKDGAVKFVVDPQMQGLSLSPQQATIPAGGGEVEVSVHYFASEPGKYSGVVSVNVEGYPPKRLEVVAEVVESRVSVVHPLSGDAVSKLNFGKLFYGQTRQLQVLLRNCGQHPVSYTIRAPEDAQAGTVGGPTSVHVSTLGGDDDHHNGNGIPFDCKPTEARLKGNEEALVTFTFSPTQVTTHRGWEHSRAKADELVKEWNLAYTIEVVETEQQIPVMLVAKAVSSEITITETCFNFPDVPVNDHASMLFSFTNDSSELPISFTLGRVAHFQCQPTSGTVGPKGQQNVVVTFHPNQLGAFRASIPLSINMGAKELNISVNGKATSIGAKSGTVGGVDKVKEDFLRPRKVAQSNNGSASPNNTTNGKPDPSWLTGEGEDGLEGGNAGADQDLLLMSEWQQKREHNYLYNNFVTNCRNIRTYNDRLRKGLMVDANAEDIGMVPAEGLIAPEPKLPRKEDPLPFLAMGGRGGAGGAAGAGADGEGEDGAVVRKSFGAPKLDENKLMKKKFKATPTTLNEQRECKLVLNPKDIQSILIPIKVLDFGQVSVFSTNAKSFFVVNGTKTHIWVQIPRGIRDELALSTPRSQVIPPGSTAGFDMIFRSEIPQPFQQAIHFTINDTHKLKFVVFAEAVPIDVSLSHNDLVFRFPEFGHDPSITLPVTLTNSGNSDAEFSWSLPSQEGGSNSDGCPFMFNPMSGVIPPHGNATVDISYTPVLTSNETQMESLLKVKGGLQPKKLMLSGSVQPAACTWNVKDGRVDFRKIPVGSTKTQIITLKNTSPNSTVFAFDTSQLAPGVIISPNRGRISAGATEEVLIQVRATAPQLIKSIVSCHIRGMKQLLKFQLTAEAKLPEFYISEPAEGSGTAGGPTDSRLDFGGVYVGSQEYRRLTVQNNDDVLTSLVIDLSHFPKFSLCDSDRRLVENVVASGDDGRQGAGSSETPAAAAATGGTLAVLRPKGDDDYESTRSGGPGAGNDDDKHPFGSAYRVTILPHASLSFHLCFTPTSVGPPEQFLLPMSLYGTDAPSPNLRPIVVTCQGNKPRLVLSPSSTVDFGPRVVIREGTSKAPNRILVKLSNETDGELVWDLDNKEFTAAAAPAAPSAPGAPPGTALSEVFRVEPMSGRLQPGQSSQVQFTFSPLEVRSYSVRYAVYLDGNKKSKYMEVNVKGFGANPALTFDRREVILPPVPLDIPSKLTFFIGNEGYESLDLKYRIAGDGKLPLTLQFPEGQTITSNHTSLPVEATFLSKKPMTFVVNVDFYDDADNLFSIPVTCTADNSILTNYGYLKWRDAGGTIGVDSAIAAANAAAAAAGADGKPAAAAGAAPAASPAADKNTATEKKPLMFRESDDTPLDKEGPRQGGAGKSDTASTVGGGGSADEPSNPFSAVDIIHRKSITKRFVDRLRVWLNGNVLPEPLEPKPDQPDLIAALQNSHGRLMSDIIELLYGKPPTLPKGDKNAAGAGANAGGAAANGGEKRKETELDQLENMLQFLKQFGANVCDVRAEFLLKYDDYARAMDAAAANPSNAMSTTLVSAHAGGKGSAALVAGGGNARAVMAATSNRLNERRFAFRAMHAWTTVILQVIKVFYLSRITWRVFKASPQSPPMAQAAAFEKWASLNTEPSSSGSNVYSVPEGLLLKWLTIHMTAVYGGGIGGSNTGADKKDDAARRRDPNDPNSTAGGQGGYLRITNFESDIRDGRAFAAVLQSYIPQLAAKFDPNREGSTFVLQPSTALDVERNLDTVLGAMREYGMETKLTARDILDHTARENILFTAYLYGSLPHYIPKTTIKFKGKLLEKIVKVIELSNPTKYPIDYSVTIEGCDDFKVAETKFHLEPKTGSAGFPVSITPRFTKKSEGRIMFLSSRGGSSSAGAAAFGGATMVFGLETEVETDSSVKTVDTMEIPQYESLMSDIMIDNPFGVPGVFTVQVQQEYIKESASTVVGGGAPTKGGNSGTGAPEEESIHSFPEAFWTPMDTISLKKTEKTKFALQFMPCVRGKYRARVIFREDRIGEFAYTFIGTCLPPRPSETLTMQTEAFVPQQREIILPLRHAMLEKALSQKEERFKMFKGRNRGGAIKNPTGEGADGEGKEVVYKVELLNEKYLGPNPFFSAPKQYVLRPQIAAAAAAAPGEEASDDRKGGKKDSSKGNDKSGAGTQAPLVVTFNPKGPGTYNCYVMLSSSYDVRVLMIEAKARSPGMKAELEFACPARQQISQDIPITNTTEKEWVISAALTGEYFSGPRELRVPPGRSRNYTLLFNPTWVCEVTGQLILKNADTQEKYTFTLKAKAEEPLAESTIVVECRARESRKLTIHVSNITFDEVTYNVETDLPFVSGDTKLTVAKMEVGKYVLHVSPQLSGKLTGSITFVVPHTKQYVWFVIQLAVSRPPPEGTITIASEVRKGAMAEIKLSNPSNKAIDFVVRRRGEGLLGDELLSLEPKQRDVVYQLAYLPTKAGETEGVVSFNNDDVGEFWYKLNLVATEAAPVALAFQCELGKSTAQDVIFENPTDAECVLAVSNSNDVNFTVTPTTLLLRPKGELKATITYMPSAIQQAQDATIKVSHPKAGQWEYRCKGVGLAPTKMEPVVCHAEVNRTSTSIVVFRNPFPVPKRFVATLRAEDFDSFAGSQLAASGVTANNGPFSLMTKKQSTSLGPFQVMQIPLAYTPTMIAQHRASIVVQLMEQVDGELKWEFPVVGTAECSHVDPSYKLVCKARKELTQVMSFPLFGAMPSGAAAAAAAFGAGHSEDYTAEIFVPRELEMRRAAANAISMTRIASPQDNVVSSSGQSQVSYAFTFAPFRPFRVTVDLIVKKAQGGVWRFPIQLEATMPDFDDVIVIEAAVNVMETATFNLYNVLPQPRPFAAYFTQETPQEFTVTPSKGILPPMPGSNGAELSGGRGGSSAVSGQPISVSFASTQYGKTLTGCLIVETDEMLWRYEVRGTLPKYQPPTGVKSKVQNRLRADTEVALKGAKR